MRAAADDEDLPVPSPTYLLQNIYDDLEGALAGLTCWHSFWLLLSPLVLQLDTFLL